MLWTSSDLGQARFLVKELLENILGLVGHTASVITTQFCGCSVKAAIDNSM